jgi:hypothetical protein
MCSFPIETSEPHNVLLCAGNLDVTECKFYIAHCRDTFIQCHQVCKPFYSLLMHAFHVDNPDVSYPQI